MHTIKDDAGRDWTLHLKVSTCDKVLDKLKFDLLEPAKDADKIQSALESPRGLLDFLWVVVEGQHPDISQVDFLDSIEDLSEAKIAVYNELESFFQRSAPDFLKVFNQMKTAARKILDAQEKKIRELLESGELEAHLETGIDANWKSALKRASESQSIEPLAKPA